MTLNCMWNTSPIFHVIICIIYDQESVKTFILAHVSLQWYWKVMLIKLIVLFDKGWKISRKLLSKKWNWLWNGKIYSGLPFALNERAIINLFIKPQCGTISLLKLYVEGVELFCILIFCSSTTFSFPCLNYKIEIRKIKEADWERPHGRFEASGVGAGSTNPPGMLLAWLTIHFTLKFS